MAENLELRRNEFATRISEMTGCSLDKGLEEVDLSICRLFHWGAYCDKYGGTVQVFMNTYLDFLGCTRLAFSQQESLV